MIPVKPFATYAEQIEKLRSRGCRIDNDAEAIQILSTINYYRLSAYFLPFANQDGSYHSATSLARVYHLYEVDRQFRALILSAIERIEIFLRSTLAYYHAAHYGPLGYGEANNYAADFDFNGFALRIKSDKNNRRKELFVRHHQEKYADQFPLWVIVEIFSFGTLSRFFTGWKTADQKEISREFYDAPPHKLCSWLKCCVDLRNISAHYGRLYFRKFLSTPAPIKNLLTLPQASRLFGALMVLNFLSVDREKWQNETVADLRRIIDAYRADIDLAHLGFPDDWENKLSHR